MDILSEEKGPLTREPVVALGNGRTMRKSRRCGRSIAWCGACRTAIPPPQPQQLAARRPLPPNEVHATVQKELNPRASVRP